MHTQALIITNFGTLVAAASAQEFNESHEHEKSLGPDSDSPGPGVFSGVFVNTAANHLANIVVQVESVNDDCEEHQKQTQETDFGENQERDENDQSRGDDDQDRDHGVHICVRGPGIDGEADRDKE